MRRPVVHGGDVAIDVIGAGQPRLYGEVALQHLSRAGAAATRRLPVDAGKLSLAVACLHHVGKGRYRPVGGGTNRIARLTATLRDLKKANEELVVMNACECGSAILADRTRKNEHGYYYDVVYSVTGSGKSYLCSQQPEKFEDADMIPEVRAIYSELRTGWWENLELAKSVNKRVVRAIREHKTTRVVLSGAVPEYLLPNEVLVRLDVVFEKYGLSEAQRWTYFKGLPYIRWTGSLTSYLASVQTGARAGAGDDLLTDTLINRGGDWQDVATMEVLRQWDPYLPWLSAGLYTGFGKVVLWQESMIKEAYLTERIRGWLFAEPPRGLKSISQESLVRVLMSGRGDRTDRMLSFDEFLDDRALWAVSGASDVRMHNGMPSTKTGNAFGLTLEQLRAEADAPTEEIRLIEKSEAGKVRLVALSSLGMYLNMRYVLHYLLPIISGNKYMYYYMDPEQQIAMWQEVSLNCSTGERVMYATDASGWDESMTRDKLEAALDAVEIVLREKYGSFVAAKELLERLDKVRTLARNGYLNGELITNGLPSGWNWTALLNSLINAAMMLMVHLEGSAVLAAGDDALAMSPRQCGNPLTLEEVASRMAEFGVKINVSKSKAGTGSTDFLKMAVDAYHHTIGQGGRLLRSVLYSEGDVSETGLDARQRLSERAALWGKLAARDWRAPEAVVVNDLFGAASRTISKSDLSLMLRVAPANGGFGYMLPERADTSDMAFVWSEDGRQRAGVRNAAIVLPKRLTGLTPRGVLQAGVARQYFPVRTAPEYSVLRSRIFNKQRSVFIRKATATAKPVIRRDVTVTEVSACGSLTRDKNWWFTNDALRLFTAGSVSSMCSLAAKLPRKTFADYVAGGYTIGIAVPLWYLTTFGEMMSTLIWAYASKGLASWLISRGSTTEYIRQAVSAYQSFTVLNCGELPTSVPTELLSYAPTFF